MRGGCRGRGEDANDHENNLFFLNLERCHPSEKQKKSPKKLNPFVKIAELAYAIMANSADADQTSSGSLRFFSVG